MSKSTWNSGRRTQQYYGLRCGFKWEISTKTRDPVAAMQEKWKENADAVTMLALATEPTPVKRDWRRYDSQFELVDLGRNHRTAWRTLRELQEEARTEASLVGRASEAHYERVLSKIESHADYNNDDVVNLIQAHGLVNFFRDPDSEDHLCNAFAAQQLAPILKKHRGVGIAFAEDEDDEQKEDNSDPAGALWDDLQTLRMNLLENLVDNRPSAWLGERVLRQIREEATRGLIGKIDEWSVVMEDVHAARQAIQSRDEAFDVLAWLAANGVSADESAE